MLRERGSHDTCHLIFSSESNDAVHRLTIFKQDHVRDAHNVEALSEFRVFVDYYVICASQYADTSMLAFMMWC